MGFQELARPRAAVILSDKSSGSSLLQRLLTSAGGRTLERTPHMEGETLYFSKAVAALDLPQPTMLDSHAIPMPQGRGATALLSLLADNTDRAWSGPVDRTLVEEGWTELARRHAPVLVEKSPHHLHNRSALDLLLGVREVDLRVVGLVRHPVDTLYSMWRRWGVVPAHRQEEWARAYEHLLEVSGELGERFMMVRYEDLVADAGLASDVAKHCGLPGSPGGEGIRRDAVAAWRSDRAFRFDPSPRVVRLASRLGYDDVEDVRGSRPRWAAQRMVGVARSAISERRRAQRRRAAA